MSDNMSDIAVIVVNYGTADLAIKAVDSVVAQSDAGARVTVHLVDNASPGGDAATLQQAHETHGWGSAVQLWLETENHGFGRGNNVVLSALAQHEQPPDKVLLLNPDARLENDVIPRLAAALDADPQAAAAGACVLRPDHTPTTAAFRFPSPASEFARVVRLGVLDRMLKGALVPLPADHPPGPVDWVSGASVMFRFQAIAEIDFFDPGFFLYYEEVDLMRRLHAQGWRVLYVPDAHVVHEEGAATGQFAGSDARRRTPDYLYHSWAHYFRGAYGRGGALAIALMLCPAAALNILHMGLRGRTPTVPLQFFRDHWHFVIRPLLGRRRQS